MQIISLCSLAFLTLLEGKIVPDNKDECRDKIIELMNSKMPFPGIVDQLSFCLSEINDSISWAGKTLLHIAAEKGNIQVMDQLIQEGAKIDPRDKDALTPLLRAAIQGKEKAVNLLLEKGADSAFQSKFGGDYKDYLAMTLPILSKGGIVAPTSPYFRGTPDNLEMKSQCFGKGVIPIQENVVNSKKLNSMLQASSLEYDQVLSVAPDMIPKKIQNHFLNTPFQA